MTACFLLGACTFTRHEVPITATATLTPGDIGRGRLVELEVVDDRDDVVVGQRGAGMQGADITAGDIVSVLHSEVGKGLQARGFRLTAGERTTDRELELRLRAFKFFIEYGFWTGAENVSVVVSAEAKNGRDDLDKTYRFNSENRALFTPSGSSIDAKLNAALAQVMTDIVADDELLRFLAR